jgi:hypothetical protein
MKSMNLIIAIVAGLIGTAVISLLMAMGPRMGMPKMAIWEMLGTMFDPQGNSALGWVMHFMTGTAFAVVYAVLWSVGLGAPTLLWGALFGAVHFLLVGAMMGAMPVMHAGIKAGTVQAPGLLMLNNGVMGFMGGLIGHIAFGLVVAAIYAPLAG